MEKLLFQLKALADETRLKITKMLLSHDLCVGAIAKRIKISKAAVSQHLKILREANLVTGEKRGYWMHYRVNRREIEKLAQELSNLASIETPPEHTCFRTKYGGDILGKTKINKMEGKRNV